LSERKMRESHKDREKNKGPGRAEQFYQSNEMKERKKIQAGNYFGSVQKKKPSPLCRLGV